MEGDAGVIILEPATGRLNPVTCFCDALAAVLQEFAGKGHGITRGRIDDVGLLEVLLMLSPEKMKKEFAQVEEKYGILRHF